MYIRNSKARGYISTPVMMYSIIPGQKLSQGRQKEHKIPFVTIAPGLMSGQRHWYQLLLTGPTFPHYT